MYLKDLNNKVHRMDSPLEKLHQTVLSTLEEAYQNSSELYLTVYLSSSFYKEVLRAVSLSGAFVYIDNPNSHGGGGWTILGHPVYSVDDPSGTHPDILIFTSPDKTGLSRSIINISSSGSSHG